MPVTFRALLSLFQKIFLQHRTTKVLIYPFQMQALALLQCWVLWIPNTAVQSCKNREHFSSSVMPCTMLEVWNLPFTKFPTHQPVWPQWFRGIFLANSNWFYRTIIMIFAGVFLPQQFVAIPQPCTLEHSTRKWHYLHISMTEFEFCFLIHIPFLREVQHSLICHCSCLENQHITWEKKNKLILQASPDSGPSLICTYHFSGNLRNWTSLTCCGFWLKMTEQ